MLFLILVSLLAVTDSADQTVHEFVGHCDPQGQCTYTLHIPAHEALQNPGSLDNQTSNAILAHLDRHDKQILQLLGYLGENSTEAVLNILEELKVLKERNGKLNMLIQLLVSKMASLQRGNTDLQHEINHMNETVVGHTVSGADYCNSTPCHNNAICQNLYDRYLCFCRVGFTGHNCETEIDECATNPCVHGNCTDYIGQYQCRCQNGYTGQDCQIDIDECEDRPCGLGGTCTDLIGRYTCVCEPGFSGTSCEININECISSPCENNGLCLDDINDYYCACPPGFQGVNCEEDYNECLAAEPCVYGTCNNTLGSYTCNCDYPEITGSFCEETPENSCWDLRKYQNMSLDGVYSVKAPGNAEVLASCDMTTDGGGWMIFLKRVSDSVDFNRTWVEYKYGFGILVKDFWWGSELLQGFLARENMELRIDMEDWEGNTAYALYDSFTMDEETGNFTCHIGNYSGDAGDPFHFTSSRFNQNNMPFTTWDRDNDKHYRNCAATYGSGFWYNSCWSANPTGKYYNEGFYSTGLLHDGVEWWPWKRDRYSLKVLEMKVRPAAARN